MSIRRAVITTVIAAAAAVTLSAQRAGQAPMPGLTSQTWTVDGVARTALIAAPKNPASGKLPLVFVFHGHGGSSAQAARTFRIHTAWPEAVVIYPQGLPTVGAITDPQGLLPGWQQAAGNDADRDLHFVDAMLAWTREHYAIDSARIFAAGHSNGGSMVYLLWAARGDQFAAFAPSSSVFRLDAIIKAKPKPVFIVTGRADPLVSFATQQLSLRGVLRLNRAEPDARPWSGGAEIHPSSIGADVVTYIHPGGHPMPDDAGSLMVKFFKGFPRVEVSMSAGHVHGA